MRKKTDDTISLCFGVNYHELKLRRVEKLAKARRQKQGQSLFGLTEHSVLLLSQIKDEAGEIGLTSMGTSPLCQYLRNKHGSPFQRDSSRPHSQAFLHHLQIRNQAILKSPKCVLVLFIIRSHCLCFL